MSTRGTILLAVGMLILGLALGVLTGGVAGFFIGQGTGAAISQSVPPTAIPASPNQPTPFFPRGLAPFANVAGGARIEEVEKDSPAEKAGIKVGDIITAVSSTKVDAEHSLSDLIQARKPGEKVDLAITRGAQTLTLTVELGASVQDSTKAYLGVRYTPLIPGGRFRFPGS